MITPAADELHPLGQIHGVVADALQIFDDHEQIQGGIAKSGSIFVLDMGEPVRIMDLAKKLIRAYGYEPNVDMPIKIIGLRPGEKLYEELLMDSERDKMTRTAHKKIFVANVDKIDDAQYDHMMQVLQSVEDKNDERAVEAIAEIVPTYHPAKNRPGNKPEQAAG